MNITISGVFSPNQGSFASIVSGTLAVKLLLPIINTNKETLKSSISKEIGTDLLWNEDTLGPMILRCKDQNLIKKITKKGSAIQFEPSEKNLELLSGKMPLDVLGTILKNNEEYLRQLSVAICFDLDCNSNKQFSSIKDTETIKLLAKNKKTSMFLNSACISSPLVGDGNRFANPSDRNLISKGLLGTMNGIVEINTIIEFFEQLPIQSDTARRILTAEKRVISDLKRDYILGKPSFLLPAIRIFSKAKAQNIENIYWHWLKTIESISSLLKDQCWSFISSENGVIPQSMSTSTKVFNLLDEQFNKFKCGLTP